MKGFIRQAVDPRPVVCRIKEAFPASDGLCFAKGAARLEPIPDRVPMKRRRN